MENFKNALQSLTTLKKIDDYGMFQMTYVGDYGLDEFMKVGHTEAEQSEHFVMKHLLKDIPIDYNYANGRAGRETGGGCTVFTARNENGEVLLCRNYDFAPCPSLQLFTKPDTGYASVSTVNLFYSGYSISPAAPDENKLPSGLNLESFPVLSSPYEPMDGVNAKGVAIAAIFVPQAHAPFDENKITLDQLGIMRLVLDKAANVNEAIALLQQHNIYFAIDAFVQYQIADASGRSIIVNYLDGEIKITEVPESYQVTSNFAACNPEITAGLCEVDRYDRVKTALEKNGGVLTEAQAVDLLKDIGVVFEGNYILQWSVIYNLTTLEGVIFAHGRKDNLIRFHLTP